MTTSAWSDAGARPFLDGEIPPVVDQMAEATGTAVAGYVAEGPGLSVYALEEGAVYRTYESGSRQADPARPRP